jgi:DNA-directed RNA polymerase specialized sigma24 family protein
MGLDPGGERDAMWPGSERLGDAGAFLGGWATMGTTATSLHILSEVVGVGPRLAAEIEKAYRKLGYVRPKKASAAPKRVVLAPDGSGDWLSILDSDNDRIDTGELKQLAVAITRKLGTVALLTSVYDSDSFEFVMFHNGRQIDAAVSEPESHAGGLRLLKGKRRAQAWHSAFIGRDYRRAVLAGRQRTLLEGWQERLKAPPKATTPFAEDELRAWCALAGLSPENVTTVVGELDAREDQEGLTTLVFERGAPKRAPAKPDSTGVTLAYYRSDDDCPYHRFFPAPWPRHPGISDEVQWAIQCSGGGISGLSVRLAVEGPAPVRVERVHIRALPFYNGQVTSPTSVAEHEWFAPDRGAATPAKIDLEAPAFVVPAADPQSRRLILLILTVQVTLPEEGGATLTPSIETSEGVRPSPALPPLRLLALKPAWVPLVSRSDTPQLRPAEAVLRLNTPSVWSAVAVLTDDSAVVRERTRVLAESWLEQLTPEADTVAVVHTEKHLTASFSTSKATRALPFADLTRDRLWTRLFDDKTDYQTVTIGLTRPGAAHPHAGVTLQASLRGFATLLGASTFACAIWLIDHPEVHRRLGGSAEEAAALFEAWIATVEPQQAWVTRACWIPEFNTYGDFAQTIFESAITRDWHREDQAPPTPWLRFVAPRLWLDELFIDRLELSRLRTAAELSRHGRVTALSLAPGRSLAELEASLSPVLPRFRDGSRFASR